MLPGGSWKNPPLVQFAIMYHVVMSAAESIGDLDPVQRYMAGITDDVVRQLIGDSYLEVQYRLELMLKKGG